MPFQVPEVQGNVIFESFPVGPLQCNCAIVGDPVSKTCLIIDPGGDPDRIMAIVEENDLTVKGIIHTHAHLDHILASAVIKERTGAPLLLHQGDKFLWDALEDQCAKFGLDYTPTPEPDAWLKDDHDLGCCGGVAIHTPGHTPGHVVIYHDPGRFAFVGDVIFQGSIGRTDFPRGNHQQLIDSITTKLWPLGNEMRFVPGHGPLSTFGQERQTNGFVADSVLQRA